MTETQKKKIIRGVITVKKRFCFVLSLLLLVSSFSAFALTYDELLRSTRRLIPAIPGLRRPRPRP